MSGAASEPGARTVFKKRTSTLTCLWSPWKYCCLHLEFERALNILLHTKQRSCHSILLGKSCSYNYPADRLWPWLWQSCFSPGIHSRRGRLVAALWYLQIIQRYDGGAWFLRVIKSSSRACLWRRKIWLVDGATHRKTHKNMPSDQRQNRYSEFRSLGNISSLRKLFFDSLSVVFVASVPCLRVVASHISSYCFLRGKAGFSLWRRYALMSGRLEKPETGIRNRNGNGNRNRNRNRKRQRNRNSNVRGNRYKNRDIVYFKLF